MSKLFRYECKRLLWNPFFFGFLLVLLFYGWQTLCGVTILGAANTAPFSPWSFGHYLSRMVPLLWAGALFFLTFFTSPKALRTAVLTNAAPMPPGRYALARCAAALAGTGLLALACLAEAALFYSGYFGWRHWKTLFLPALVTLVPPLVFALGSGWILGRLKPWLLYPWMLLPLLILVFPLPQACGIWNGSFFCQYPLVLETLDPPFSLPLSVIGTQCGLLAAGAGLLPFATMAAKGTPRFPLFSLRTFPKGRQNLLR